jgi:predicted AlkP superfamily pyrophosphatase or phosphodiesterase
MRTTFLFFVTGVYLLCGLSCATRYSASENYKTSLLTHPNSDSNKTVILFLVDGLPIRTLKSQLNNGTLPGISSFFMGSKNQFNKARTNFPSLTYPSIASLLTERSIDQHGIYGNKIVLKKESLDFESPTDFDKLNQQIKGKNIFSRLTNANKRSVGLSFTFNGEATAHNDGLDLKSAVAIQSGDYGYVDSKFIEALEIILTETKPSLWPDFIYVHLVGIDLLSHHYGPDSTEVASYLQFLDKRLSRVFKILKNVEKAKRRDVTALLTADHGYDKTIYKTLNLDKILPSALPNTSNLLNESRYVGFQFPADWTSQQKKQYADEIKENPSLDIIAFRDDKIIHLFSKSLKTQIYYGPRHCPDSDFTISIGDDTLPKKCPSKIPYTENQIFYPYFAADISKYFQSPGHPDIVIIPKPGISFNQTERGQHGGPTPEEIFVPLLLHNGQLPASSEIIPLSDVLKFM